MSNLMVDFIMSLDAFGTSEGWPGYWGMEGPEYLAWMQEDEADEHTALMGATTYRPELGLPGIKDLGDVHDACALAIVAVPKEFEPDVPDAANVPLSAPCSMRLRCPPTSKRSTSAAQAALRAGGCRRGPGSGQLMSVIASIED